MFITVIQKRSEEFVLSRYQSKRGALLFVRGVRHRLDDTETGIEDILASWKNECQGDRVILALLPSMFFIRELDLAVTDRKKCRELLPLELKGELADDSDELVFDALPLASGKTAAVWARQDAIAAEIKTFADAGFDPEIVTAAMFNWGTLLPEAKDAVMAVSDGEEVAFWQDGKPLFFRALPQVAGRQLDATVAAVELAKGVQVETVFTIGSGQPDTALATVPLPHGQALTSAFQGDATAATDLASQFALASELAFGDPLNLRRGAIGFTKNRDLLRKKLRITYSLAAVLILLVFAEAGVRYFVAQRDVTSLNGSIRAIYKEVFPSRTKAIDEVAEVKAEIRKLGAAGNDGILAVLKLLTEAKGDDPREIYEVDFDGSQLTGRGYDRSAQGVNDFKLKASQLFASFEVSEIKSRPDGSVGFSFRGTLKGGGK